MKVLVAFTMLVVALGIRWAYYPIQFPDFVQYLDPWLGHLRTSGPSIIGTDFAHTNYHPPYLYIIWFFSLFVSDNLIVIKLVSFLGDCALAAAVYGIISHMRPGRRLNYLVVSGVLLLPTVLINSAIWGQSDAIYSACLLFAVSAALQRRITQAWVLVALAISFKTQGIFLLPFMAYISLYYRQGLRGIAYAAVTMTALLGAPLIFGVHIDQLALYYAKDIQPMWGVKRLSWWCPNLMAWLPNAQYDQWRLAGVFLYTAILGMFGYLGFRKRFTSNEQLLTLAVLSCMLSVFVLPQMHGRYFFSGEIFLFALAGVRYRWLVAVGIAQIATVNALVIFFVSRASDEMAPYRLLSVLMGIIIGMLVFSLCKIPGGARGVQSLDS